MAERYDLLIVGAGAAGMPAAIKAAEGGARVLLVDGAEVIGGTFHLSSGQMSAAGTRIQAAKGIHDTPDMHYADIERISRGTANMPIVRLAVDNAADTLHWLLDLGLEVLPEHPVIHYGHEPYTTARTYWAAEGGLSVMAVLKPLVLKMADERDLTIRTATKLVSLDRSGDRVTGATLEHGGERYAVAADQVLLATGGFTGDAETFEAMSNGNALFGGGYAHNVGGGLKAAMAIGARVSGGEHFLPTFAAVADPAANGGYAFLTQTYPQFRAPWEVYLDLDGDRFMREDEPSVDTRERKLLATRGMAFWQVFDARIRREAPSVFEVDEAAVARHFAENPSFVTADSLDALAAKTGMDAAKVKASIAAYNDAIAAGAPDPQGRAHRPLPVAEPPFHAIRHVGWSIAGFGGLDIDTDFRVLDEAGEPIPGLYAAGEILGLAATSGNSFCGGMSVTPSMTFGRMFGERVAARVPEPAE